MILYMFRGLDCPGNIDFATVDLVMGSGQRPFVSVGGTEFAVVDGLARRISGLFTGSRLRRQTIRPPGLVPGWMRVRTRVGTATGLVITIAVTAAISAAVTIAVTKLLG